MMGMCVQNVYYYYYYMFCILISMSVSVCGTFMFTLTHSIVCLFIQVMVNNAQYWRFQILSEIYVVFLKLSYCAWLAKYYN